MHSRTRTHRLARTWSVTTVWLCLLTLTFSLIPTASGQNGSSKHSTLPIALTEQQIDDRANSILSQMTLEEKIDMLGGVDGFYVNGISRLKMPRLKMSDGPIGTRNDGPATTMAGGIALAATWNPNLAKQVGTEIGRDARARGVHFLLGPGVNIHVAPMNGRNFEYFGEDPFLASRMTVGYIEGVQSQGVSATVKHFMGNNSEFDRHNVDSVIDERTMREIYLPAFEAAVREAHVGAIMDSYNLVNGEHASQSSHLNTEITKKEWGFDGLIMSDWFATYDGVAAANSGMDLEMPSGAFMNRKTLLPAIKEGKLAVSVIDDKVRRILRIAIRFGWLDHDQVDNGIPIYNQQGKLTALQAAREGMVLLKNDSGLLPLDKGKIKSIAVIGPDANPGVPVGGGSAQVQPFSSVSFLKGLSDSLGTDASVYYHRGLQTLSQMTNATQFFTAPTRDKPGLTAELFNNPDLSGSPASTRIDRRVNQKPRFTIADLAEIDFSEIVAGLGGPDAAAPNGTSTRWTGYYVPQNAGKFEIFVHASGENGGQRLYVDDKLVFDDWTVRKALIEHTTLNLTAGPHKVVLERFQPPQPDFFGGTRRLGVVPETTVVDPAAKSLAAKADVVVVAVGFEPDSESEGADRTFSLPPGQEELIREMAAVNKNIVVVATSGGAVDTNGWLDRVPAFLAAWYPGQEGGTALADVLFGNVNPSGRLPISYDRRWEENPSHDSYYPEPGTKRVVYKNGIFVGYRGYDHAGTKPLFPFGYGLSYTTFNYRNLEIKNIGDAKRIKYQVSFAVTNTGKKAGEEVAQVYVGDLASKVSRPPKELKGFSKIYLQPGETKMVSVILDGRAFAYYDVAGKHWQIAAANYDVLVGPHSQQIELSGKISMSAAIISGIQ